MSLGGTTFHMGVFGLPIREELTRVGRLVVQQRCLPAAIFGDFQNPRNFAVFGPLVRDQNAESTCSIELGGVLIPMDQRSASSDPTYNHTGVARR